MVRKKRKVGSLLGFLVMPAEAMEIGKEVLGEGEWRRSVPSSQTEMPKSFYYPLPSSENHTTLTDMEGKPLGKNQPLTFKSLSPLAFLTPFPDQEETESIGEEEQGGQGNKGKEGFSFEATYIPHILYGWGLTYEKINRKDLAFDAFLTAAELGHRAARDQVGFMYGPKKGDSWYWGSFLSKPHDEKGGEALYKMACMYEVGKHVKVDLEKAAKLFKLAEEKGYAPGCEVLEG
jgi:hypothetical protein